MEFHNKRRQPFLTEAAYIGAKRFFEEYSTPDFIDAISRSDFDANDRRRNANVYADDCFANFMLRFTAGEPIDNLREDLDHVVFSLELAARYVQDYQNSPTFPPLRFVEIDEYERVLQLIGLCFLLHRRDLLSRVAAIFDPSSSAQDCLYEDMLSFELPDRFSIDKWYHEAYRDLINTMYGDTEQEIISDFQSYIKNWYKSMVTAPWHDSHLRIENEMCAGYFGYWSIEGAALAYLLDVNDSSFRDNLVYPKELVDYAKRMDKLDRSAAETLARNPPPVRGGNTCPESGYWMTPARLDSRKFFRSGEQMPTFVNSPYGVTIWQWSLDQ